MIKRIFITLALSVGASILAQTNIFTLCEGNYGSSNATLWTTGETFSSPEPVYWDPNTNPLGDVAHSLWLDGSDLYIVVNNSHTIEVVTLATGQPQYDRTIPVDNAGPRYLVTHGSRAYISCWNLSGILVIDLQSDALIDTIALDGMPEGLLVIDNRLYAAMTMDTNWAGNNQVVEIDLSGDPVVTRSFTVVPGPEQLLAVNGNLFVASVYYDENWNSYKGLSRINLTTGDVLMRDYGLSYEYGNDLALFQNQVFRIDGTGASPVSDSLTVLGDQRLGNFDGIFSLSAHGDFLYFGVSDYSAPDYVYVVNADNETIAQLQVGALPGDFAFYSPGSVSIEPAIDPVPLEILTLANFPNPFNPVTTISMISRESGPARLVLTNLAGQEITTIWEGIMRPGQQLVQLDAARHPSGTYFLTLHQGRHQTVKKILLLK